MKPNHQTSSMMIIIWASTAVIFGLLATLIQGEIDNPWIESLVVFLAFAIAIVICIVGRKLSDKLTLMFGRYGESRLSRPYRAVAQASLYDELLCQIAREADVLLMEKSVLLKSEFESGLLTQLKLHKVLSDLAESRAYRSNSVDSEVAFRQYANAQVLIGCEHSNLAKLGRETKMAFETSFFETPLPCPQ